MNAWFVNEFLSDVNYFDFIIRVIVAAFCGGLIGMEREIRLKNAGLRTHIIVAITAVLMTIISKYGFMDVLSIEGIKLQADASRIAHGVISAIGFLGAGVIYVRRESIVGLTTAACLWATCAVGIAIGAGMVNLGVITTLVILAVQFVLHKVHLKAKRQCAGTIRCNISKHNLSISDYEKVLTEMGVFVRDMSFFKNAEDETIVSASVVFPPEQSMIRIMDNLNEKKIFENVDISPAV